MNQDNTDEAVEHGANKLIVRLALTIGGMMLTGLTAQLIWLTSEAFESRSFRNAGDRYTQGDAAMDKSKTDQKIAQLETQLGLLAEARQDLKILITEVSRLTVTVEKLERSMR